MTTRTKLRWLLTLLVTLTLAAAGCGGTDPGPGADAPQADTLTDQGSDPEVDAGDTGSGEDSPETPLDGLIPGDDIVPEIPGEVVPWDILAEVSDTTETEDAQGCTPDCDGAECGPDGCGGLCGLCDASPGAYCDDGVCACAPDCEDKVCADDGCGNPCGVCVCNNGICGETETATSCPYDCGPCGDGVCGAGEDGSTPDGLPVCLKDCGPVCGDLLCDEDEDNNSCPYDCPECGDGVCSPSEEAGCFFECGFGCGDGECGGFFETPMSCPEDCPQVCGDGVCMPPETLAGCPQDCTKCGDGVCSDGEDAMGCPADCAGLCGDGICGGAEGSVGCPVDCGACGDGVCGVLEQVETCPTDCGADCGDGACGDGETEESCPEDCGCLPNCAGKECGLDACGYDCGACPADATCGGDNLCHCDHLDCGGTCCAEAAVCFEGLCCLADCAGKACGDDGCGGSCGGCPDLEVCADGQCACAFVACLGSCCLEGQTCHQGACCTPLCEGKECGDDQCGGDCGTCGFANECEQGLCVWQVFCGNDLCEPDADEDCLSCDQDCGCGQSSVCMDDGACCDLQCAGKECGPDGCGGSCGECLALSSCTEGICTCDFEICGAGCCGDGEVCLEGACCLPDCLGKQCGDDGCGGSCGDCGEAFGCKNSLCQCENVIWTRNHGDDDTDRIYDVSASADGYFFAGRLQELMDYHDFWVGGVNDQGLLQWSHDYSGSGSFSKDMAFGVATTPDGGVIAVGKKDTGIWYSGWARKLGADGGSGWAKTFGGNGLNEFRDVVVSDDGTYVAVGQVFSGYTYKGWLVELDPTTGNSITSRTYVASGAFDVLRGIEKVSAGGYVAVGCAGLQSIDSEDYVSPGQLWLLRLNDSFDVVWSKKLASSSEGFTVAETDDGFVAAGYVWNGSNRDIRVVRTDLDGTKLWEQTYGWGKDDVARDVVLRPFGTFLLTGYAVPPGQTDSDLFIMELNPAGGVLWQTFLGNTSSQAGYSLLPVSGEPDTFVIGGRNGNDGWLVKFTTCY